MQDLDTMTNVILNNEYDLHEKDIELTPKNKNDKNAPAPTPDLFRRPSVACSDSGGK